MTKKVLILVGIPHFDYSNEKSAVSSFLLEIKRAFEDKGMEVEFPPFKKSKSVVSHNENKKIFIGKLKLFLKKWPWFYQSIVHHVYFKEQDVLYDELSNLTGFTHIVEFHTVGSTIGQKLSDLFGAKFSVIFDSPVDEQFLEMHGTKSGYWKKIKKSEQITLEAANKIMVYSPACEEYIKKKYHLDCSISILPCVINKGTVKNESESQSEFKIGFIGSFLSWHKVELLVKAYKVFKEKYSDSKLCLIGYGEEWGRIKDLIESEGLIDHVDLPGFVFEEELIEYKKQISIAVMPGSNWYGSPLKLFEYGQSGIPFIAPKTKTVTSIFKDKEHCLYIDPENELESLIKLLFYLYENKKESALMGERVYAYYQECYAVDIYSKNLFLSLNID